MPHPGSCVKQNWSIRLTWRMIMPDAAQPSREAALQTLFEVLQPLSLAPLWTQYRAMLTPTPQGKARPYLWRYAELRPHLLRAGELISTREAERRVLM